MQNTIPLPNYNGVTDNSVFPLFSYGCDNDRREYRQCFLHLDADGLSNDNTAKISTLENYYNTDILATKDGIGDYYGGVIIRWKPKDDYLGTAITIGHGAYEWHTNGCTANSNQANIERLTSNALDELAPALTVYNITYNLGSGTNSAENPSTYTSNIPVTLQEASRTGYTFAGWQTPGGIPVTELAFGSTGDTVLNAQWTPVVYNITYVSGGATLTEINSNPTTYTIEDNINFLALTASDSTFAGWWTGANGTGTSVTSFPAGTYGDTTIYAKWSGLPVYYVVLTSNGIKYDSIPVEQGSYVAVPATPIRHGYDFAGWYTAEVSGSEFAFAETSINTGIQIYAYWTLHTYNIYLIKGGNAGDTVIETYNIESAHTIVATASKDGYNFEGWYTNPGGEGTKVTELASGAYGDTAFYAKFTPVTYTLYFNSGGGVYTGRAEQSVTYASAIDSLPLIAAKEGYNFTGWGWEPLSVAPINETDIYNFTKDSTLYAQYKAISISDVAFVSIYSTLPELKANGDDDEVAAGEWFVNIYGGYFLPIDSVSKCDLTAYKAMWLHVDRPTGHELPLQYFVPESKTAITNYYATGGNLLLTVHAYQYLQDIGRITYDVDAGSFNGKGLNGWELGNSNNSYLQTFYGREGVTTTFNYHNDSLYKGLANGLEMTFNGDVNCWVYPLTEVATYEGIGERHNCFLTMDLGAAPASMGNLDAGKISYMRENYGAIPLGTRDGIGDYYGMAIARWLPFGSVAGTAITIGHGAYEWNYNNGSNPNQHNIEQLTLNALNELRGAAAINWLDTANAAKIDLTWDEIRLQNTTQDSVVSNLTLPAAGTRGTIVTWESSNTDVISLDGTVSRPAAGSIDADVTLTATLSIENTFVTKTFALTVKAELLVTGSEVVATNARISAYPNPASEKVTIAAGEGIKSITFVNTFGRDIYSINVNGAKTHSINIADMPAGVYIVKVETESGVETLKIIIK
jgi:uncharacterized repeat protein (TIGR02543 family)